MNAAAADGKKYISLRTELHIESLVRNLIQFLAYEEEGLIIKGFHLQPDRASVTFAIEPETK